MTPERKLALQDDTKNVGRFVSTAVILFVMFPLVLVFFVCISGPIASVIKAFKLLHGDLKVIWSHEL